MTKTMIFYYILDLMNTIAFYEEDNALSENYSDYKAGIAQGKRDDIRQVCCFALWDKETVIGTIKTLQRRKINIDDIELEKIRELVEKF